MALRSIAGGLRGGVAFLTRVPVGSDEADWDRFRSFPAAFPLVAYPIGAVAALPFLSGLSAPTVAFGYLLALVAVVGIPHFGAIVAVAVVVGGLLVGAVGLANAPPRTAVGIVVAAEVGAKLGMATVACLASAAHEGLGSAFTERAEPVLLLGPGLAALPAALLVGPVRAGVAAVAAGPLVAVGLIRWAEGTLGGVNGDVFGATNELARVLGLHLGVIAWTLS